MHQKEIDRAAGSAIGGTIAGLFIVFLIFFFGATRSRALFSVFSSPW